MLKIFLLSILTVTALSATLPPPMIAGYLLMGVTRNGEKVGMKELNTLADNALSLPITRLVIGFFDPTMVYVKGSNTLQFAGLGVSDSGDYGFADLKAAINQLRTGDIEVYLSMGGWNYNCWPYMYMNYSVGGYGPNTPNFWKIQAYGGGDVKNCNDSNQYCYVCEPPSENTTLSAFSIFPEVPHSSVWQQAIQYVASGAKGNETPKWNDDIVPGTTWTDPRTGRTVPVPGNNMFVGLKTDPYQDMVNLAIDLDVDGIDVDYEEFWHADYFKYGTSEGGPWWLPQTVYKYAAITKTFMLHIQNAKAKVGLATAASAVGAWATNWWGGNLKGVWFWLKQWYPDIIDFYTSTGGINVMTYDLSKNPQYHECPADDKCDLNLQVQFYMETYKNASIPANVGYEIGTPAYPAPDHDPTHQLPLTKDELAAIIKNTQPNISGFFWEMYKPVNNSNEATPTDVAQAICNTISTGSSRCSGVIPPIEEVGDRNRAHKKFIYH